MGGSRRCCRGAVLDLPLQLGSTCSRVPRCCCSLSCSALRWSHTIIAVLLGQHPQDRCLSSLPGLGGTGRAALLQGGCNPQAGTAHAMPRHALLSHLPGMGTGDSGYAAGRSLRLLPPPLAALHGCHNCEGAPRVLTCAQGRRGRRVPGLGGERLTPRWWGWGPRAGPGEPPPHSFCLRVCLSGRAGAACALSANAAPCFLMLMLL